MPETSQNDESARDLEILRGLVARFVTAHRTGTQWEEKDAFAALAKAVGL